MNYSDAPFQAYKVEEIAHMLGLGKTKTRELLKANILPVVRIGRQYFTSPDAIQEFLTNNIHKAIYY